MTQYALTPYLATLCGALFLSACAQDTPETTDTTTGSNVATTQTITGQLSYRERIALRPGHTMTVSLSDVSIADRAAPVLASTERVLSDEQVPLAFTLDVASDELTDRGRYAVRGTLTGPDGNLAWTTDTAHLIDTDATEQDLGILRLVKVNTTPSAASYDCGAVAFTATFGEAEATLTIGDMDYVLPRVEAASGAKFQSESDNIMFWDKGDMATLDMDDTVYSECRKV